MVHNRGSAVREFDSPRLKAGVLDHLGDGVDLVLDNFRECFRSLSHRLHAKQRQLRGHVAFLYDRAAVGSDFANDVVRYSGAAVAERFLVSGANLDQFYFVQPGVSSIFVVPRQSERTTVWRNLMRAALIVASYFLALCWPHSGNGAGRPTRTVIAVVPLPAGTSVDSMARIVMQQLAQQVGQSFVVENKPGAGGTIGTNFVVEAPPDGHTLLVYGAAASAAALYLNLPYDTLNDLTPVIALGQQPLVVVAPVGRFKDLADLIAQTKARPGALNFSTPGVGTASHFGAARLMLSAGFLAQHVPFKGDYMVEIVAGKSTSALRRSGRQSALSATTNLPRSRLAPTSDHLPCQTYQPCSKQDSEMMRSIRSTFRCLHQRRRPLRILDKLYTQIRSALSVPFVHDRAVDLGFEPMPLARAEMRGVLSKRCWRKPHSR